MHRGGTVEVNYLADAGDGHDRRLVQQKKMSNRALARLGMEGREVVPIFPVVEGTGMLRYPHRYAVAESCRRSAFLERPTQTEGEPTT